MPPRRPPLGRFACPLLAAAFLLAGCGGGDEGTEAANVLRAEEIASVREPIFLAQPPEGDERLYVVERAGRIRVIDADGTVSREPFLDIRDEVFTEAESGMLSMAFAPDYEDSGLLYVVYSSRHGTLRVEEWRREEGPEPVADPSSRRLVLEIPHPREIHWGGQLQFGPDGYLYVSTGDGGPLDPKRTAQDLESQRGKLLRIDPRAQAGRPYSVPEDNPFVGEPGRDEIYAYGLRNPWRFSFDRETGALVIGDVGHLAQEEVDYVEPGEGQGANFGWPTFEGIASLRKDVPAPGAVPPIFTYEHTDEPVGNLDPVCAITGGYVVRDPRLPSLQGRYLYADFCMAQVRSFLPDTEGAQDDRSEELVIERIASFAEDAAGHLYALSLNGDVLRLGER